FFVHFLLLLVCQSLRSFLIPYAALFRSTATLYILTSMAVLVVMVWAAVGQRLSPDAMATASGPILALAISTALSRLTMFSGVKRSEEHTSELQSCENRVCRLLLEQKKRR